MTAKEFVPQIREYTQGWLKEPDMREVEKGMTGAWETVFHAFVDYVADGAGDAGVALDEMYDAVENLVWLADVEENQVKREVMGRKIMGIVEMISLLQSVRWGHLTGRVKKVFPELSFKDR